MTGGMIPCRGLSGQVGDRGSGDELNELSLTLNRLSGSESEHEAATTLDWCVLLF